MSSLQTLYLESLHQKYGAKFAEFAGYLMPMQYQDGLMKEHLHTRAEASLFDVSHMVQLRVSGANSVAFLRRLLPISVDRQKIHKARYTIMMNEDAGIIDDLIITKLDETAFLLVLNAACIEHDMRHIQALAKDFESFELKIIEDRCLIAVQGPKSTQYIISAIPELADIDTLAFMEQLPMLYKKHNMLVARSGYTGEDGFEFCVPHTVAEDFVKALLKSGKIKCAGLAARNSLRLEAGLHLYGKDMDEQYHCYEADLGFAISKLRLEEEHANLLQDFVGKARIKTLQGLNLSRKRVGIKSSTRQPLRDDIALYVEDNSTKKIGRICSGGFSPSLEIPIGFAYVDSPYFLPGTKLYAEIRGKFIELEVCSLPFIPHNYKRKKLT